MFEIKQPDRRSQQIFISHPDRPMHVLRVDDLNELAELHNLLGEQLAKKRVGEFIGSSTAQKIAKEEGYNIPITTLVNACVRGSIPAAYKKRSRWLFPKDNFMIWYQEWKAKYERQKAEEIESTNV